MNLNEQLARAFDIDQYRGAGLFKAAKADAVTESIVPMHSLQRILRPLFGKGPPNLPEIGDHPDFQHLKGTTNQQFAPITTLFFDIENSTRLGLLYDPEDVYAIKNAFICTAIEIVRAFDGHVHRIMGDAVMAYFGRTVSIGPEQGAVDAMNCAAALQYFSQYVIVPKLEHTGFTESEFGIRVGVDYGPAEKVLWASYGYPGIEEVTATSFNVDAASKLQHAARRNQVMIGDSLIEFLDYPRELLAVQFSARDGRKIDEPYLTPNLTDGQGQPVNYRQHVLRCDQHLSLTQLSQEQTSVRATNPVRVVVTRAHEQAKTAYLPASLVLPKGDNLTFSVTVPPIRSADSVTFSAENHGAEAKAAGEKYGDRKSTRLNSSHVE